MLTARQQEPRQTLTVLKLVCLQRLLAYPLHMTVFFTLKFYVIQVTLKETHRTYLLEEELQTLAQKNISIERLRTVRDIFPLQLLRWTTLYRLT